MVRLSELVETLPQYELYNFIPDLYIDKIAVDSRKAEANDLFACIIGEKHNGHDFVEDAMRNGAIAIVCEHYLSYNIPQIVVPCTKTAVSQLAAAYYSFPSSKLKVIGITGTNGKTTTTYIVRHIFNETNNKCGLIGTVEIDDGLTIETANLTTPQPLELQSHLSKMEKNGCRYVVMEVSSHALALHRVDNVVFQVAGFTNLTQDHLDYHGTMENYKQAKGQLFQKAELGVVINSDDQQGKYMASHADVPVLYYSCNQMLADGIYITGMKMGSKGTEFTLHYRNIDYQVKSKLIGKFNVYNMLLAFGIAVTLGLAPTDIVKAIATFEPVPGRFASLSSSDFTVIVDFAHSPDALANVLKTARSISKNRLIVVFGCGGDRDREKRPLMGRIALEYADFAIITSDNPRTEDPLAIIDDICAGINHRRSAFEVEVDRKTAIERSITLAQPGDVILIAGKGHETYQIIGEEVLPFDDKLIAEQKLSEVNSKCNNGALRK